MKIQCDVCNKSEASVFCSADEAALCDACDRRVHHANKLASKHHRFSLLNPSSSKDSPRCDICQERRAFQFCREDRALLCRECDLSIHTANEYTQKHNRFLLTGVKLSSTSSIFSPTSTTSSTSKTNTTITSSSKGCDVSIDSRTTTTTTNTCSIKKKPNKSVSDSFCSGIGTDDQIQINASKQSQKGSGDGGLDYYNQPTPSAAGSTSSISEYLIEMLPGWQVDDLLLDSSSAPTNGFCKNDDLFFDTNFEANLGNFATDDLTLWVPEISTPTPPPPAASHPHLPLMAERKNVLYKELKEVISNNPNSKVMNRRWREHSLTVPQISPPSIKRSRNLW